MNHPWFYFHGCVMKERNDRDSQWRIILNWSLEMENVKNMEKGFLGLWRMDLAHYGDKKHWVHGVYNVIIMNLRDNAIVCVGDTVTTSVHMLSEARKRDRVPWSWIYKGLWATRKILGTKLGSCGRQTRAFNHRDTSSACSHVFGPDRRMCPQRNIALLP